MSTRKIPKFLKWLYIKILRPWIYDQLYNQENSWDDYMMTKLDELFMYKN